MQVVTSRGGFKVAGIFNRMYGSLNNHFFECVYSCSKLSGNQRILTNANQQRQHVCQNASKQELLLQNCCLNKTAFNQVRFVLYCSTFLHLHSGMLNESYIPGRFGYHSARFYCKHCRQEHQFCCSGLLLFCANFPVTPSCCFRHARTHTLTHFSLETQPENVSALKSAVERTLKANIKLIWIVEIAFQTPHSACFIQRKSLV